MSSKLNRTTSRESLMRSRLECSICMTQYDHTTMIPKVLTCGHTFCINCIRKLCITSQIQCPKCRQTTSMECRLVEDLPTNFGLLDLLTTCEQCGDSPCLSDPCGHCKAHLCDFCHQKHFKAFKVEMAGKLKEFHLCCNNSMKFMDGDMYGSKIEEKASDDLDMVELTLKKLRTHIDEAQGKIEENVQNEREETLKCYNQWKLSTSKEVKDMIDFVNSTLSCLNEGKLSFKDLLQVCCELKTFEEKLEEIKTKRPEWKRNFGHEMSVMCLLLAANQPISTNKNSNRPIESDADAGSLKSTEVMNRPVPKLDSTSTEDITGCCKFNGPWAVIESEHSGTIYVSDQNNHKVHIILHDKVKCFSIGHFGNSDGAFNHPRGLALDKNDNLYVSDSHNNRIQVFNNVGRFLYTFGSYGNSPGMFDEPRSMFIDNQCRLFVCDGSNYRVQVMDLDGTFIRLFGCKGSVPGQFQTQPYGITIDPVKHNIFVSEYAGHITIFSYAGDPIKKIQGHSIFFGQSRGIVFGDGYIFVSDQERNSIVVLDRDGEQITKYDMQQQSPVNLAWTRAGQIMVALWVPNAVKVFKFQ